MLAFAYPIKQRQTAASPWRSTPQRNIDLLGRRHVQLAYLGRGYALSGKKNEAVKLIRELEKLFKDNYVSPTSTAMVYIGLGEEGRVFELLEEAYRERCNNLVFINVHPAFDKLRSGVRFISQIRKMSYAS